MNHDPLDWLVGPRNSVSTTLRFRYLVNRNSDEHSFLVNYSRNKIMHGLKRLLVSADAREGRKC